MFSCVRCEDSGAFYDERMFAFACDCSDVFGGYGFPEIREARLPEGLERWAVGCMFPSAAVIIGPLAASVSAGKAVCRLFYEKRGARSMRFVDALSSPTRFSDRWDVLETRPDVVFLSNVDKRLRPPQVQAICNLLQSRSKLVNVVMTAGVPSVDELVFQLHCMEPSEFIL